MSGYSILLIELSQSEGIKIIIGPLFFAFLFAIAGVVWWWGKKKIKQNWDVDFSLDLKSPVSIKIKPNHDVVRVAHQVWTELQTRKAALPFDENDDVILEVYNSWYALFGIIRNLIKTIPAEHVKGNEDTAKLVSLLIDVLNLGLRPHLTRWQARYRAWHEKNADPAVAPQDMQKRYPEYAVLVSELKQVNQEMSKFATALYLLVRGK